MREYRLIDADCHTVEPPNLWETWLPKEFLARAPKLVKDEDGDYHLVDYKRTANDLSPNASCWGKRFLGNLPLNDHHKYSLQLSLYAQMFAEQTGERILSCRLLQIHPDLEAHRWVYTSDLAAQARTLLEGVGVAASWMPPMLKGRRDA